MRYIKIFGERIHLYPDEDSEVITRFFTEYKSSGTTDIELYDIISDERRRQFIQKQEISERKYNNKIAVILLFVEII